MISGAPVVVGDNSLGSAWRPENYSKKFFGLTRMREALKRSLNLVSIRLMRSVGIDQAREHLQKFGFKPENLPNNLSLALGNASLLPIEVARAYAVFANGGFLVEPYLIERIEDSDGETVYQAAPLTACELCPSPLQTGASLNEETTETEGLPSQANADQAGFIDDQNPGETPTEADEQKQPAHAPWAISRENAFLISSMLEEVIRSGTGRRARSLGRSDIAGKTGTTNEQQDAWFSGFGPGVETTVYIGFDEPAPLGRREVGGRAALPVWIDYMKVALRGTPEKLPDIPAGIVPVYISRDTGKQVPEDHPDAMLEYFMLGLEPEVDTSAPASPLQPAKPPVETLPDDIL
jgi:penicillin-binding protein 1A